MVQIYGHMWCKYTVLATLHMYVTCHTEWCSQTAFDLKVSNVQPLFALLSLFLG